MINYIIFFLTATFFFLVVRALLINRSNSNIEEDEKVNPEPSGNTSPTKPYKPWTEAETILAMYYGRFGGFENDYLSGLSLSEMLRTIDRSPGSFLAKVEVFKYYATINPQSVTKLDKKIWALYNTKSKTEMRIISLKILTSYLSVGAGKML